MPKLSNFEESFHMIVTMSTIYALVLNSVYYKGAISVWEFGLVMMCNVFTIRRIMCYY